MLETLGRIDWTQLHGAYGPAESVPKLLHATARSEDPTNEALLELMNELNHQGTTYEATAHIVPFLVELARGGPIAGRPHVLHWLAELADKIVRWDKHPPKGRPGINPFNREPMMYLPCDDRVHAKACREAVGAAFDDCLAILRASEGPIRCAAAHVVSSFPGRADEIAPHLLAALDQEPMVSWRAGLILSLGRLGSSSPEVATRMDALLRSGATLDERFAAAVGLVAAPPSDRREAATALLRECYQAFHSEEIFPDPPELTYRLHWLRKLVDESLTDAGIAR